MSSTASGRPDPQTIVLIHGMWMTALSWEKWVARYTERGYRVIARSWPGEAFHATSREPNRSINRRVRTGPIKGT